MNWVYGTWLVMASMCVTLALVHGLVWLRRHGAVGSAAFALMALSVAGMGYVEVRMMLAPTIEEFGRFLWWYQVPVWTAFVALVCFVRFYLRAGRAWLGWSAVGLRTLALLVNFFMTPSIQFREITSLEFVETFGTPLAIARGTPNPWLAIAHGALLVLILFLIDAMRDLWRRGQRRNALAVTGSLTLFAIAGTTLALLSYWGLAPLPVFASVVFLPIVVAMAVELGLDLINAARLSDELSAKRAEVEHMSRVATLTELSGTLAHELNQPLGIIMSNAEAAQRILESDNPDLHEVADILGDIVDADERAGAVIQRLRAMLKRSAPDRQQLAIDRVVDDVVRFMRTDLARRGIAVETVLDGGGKVHADRVSLEQVMINVIKNACDAMDGNPTGERVVSIASTSDGDGMVVRISDRGRGLPDPPERVFAPFYTTKSEGLGMGLAIARSIVASHGGRLTAERNAHGGATFRIDLPAAQSAS